MSCSCTNGCWLATLRPPMTRWCGYLKSLVRRLGERFGRSRILRDLEDLAGATGQGHVLEPERYREGERPVREFLWMDARGDALNLLKAGRPVLQCELALEEKAAEETVAEADRDRYAVQEALAALVGGVPKRVGVNQAPRTTNSRGGPRCPQSGVNRYRRDGSAVSERRAR